MKDIEYPRQKKIDRREFVALGIGALVVAAVPLRALQAKKKLFRRTLPLMGTIAEIVVVHSNDEVAQRAIDAAFRELQRVELLMSRFRSDSNVGRVNALAGNEQTLVNRDTAEVLQRAMHWARLSNGAFDPSLARVTELWDVAHRTVPPATAQYARFAGRRLFESLEIEDGGDAARVGIKDKDAAIDLGGIAKGFGVDKAVEALRRHGIENAIVDVGGDLYALGESPDGRAWNIGIRSPLEPSKIDRTISISDRAVATSGDYMQYFEYRGRRFHHIVDTRTAEPVLRNRTSVTVIADSCMDADAAATTAFVAGVDASRVIRHAAPGSSLIVIG